MYHTDPRSLTNEQRHAIRLSYGKDFALDYGHCVVYVNEGTDGRKPTAAGFAGKALKPSFYNTFHSMERLGLHADNWANLIADWNSRKASARKARAEYKHTLKVGDVLVSSWGYDQTNIDYYEVTRIIGSKMVEVCEIGQERTETGFMSGECIPAVGRYIGKPMRVRVGEGNSVRVSSCATAYPAEHKVIAGAKIYPTSHWTAYA